MQVDLPENFERIDINKVIDKSTTTEHQEVNISGIFLRGAGASNASHDDQQLDSLEQDDANSINSVHSDLGTQLI